MKGIMQEFLLPWTLNGVPQAPFLCSEGDSESLLLGHMIASGLVDDPGKVFSVRFDGSTGEVQAELCARSSWPTVRHLDALPPLEGGFALPAAEIIDCCERVMALDHGAGLHSVLLSDGKHTALGRDVGRHNAVEKAVGGAVRAGLNLERAVLASSGRLSLEMLAKAAFARIPILVTKKQAGSLCVSYAQRLNMTVCRLEAALEPFSHPERVAE